MQRRVHIVFHFIFRISQMCIHTIGIHTIPLTSRKQRRQVLELKEPGLQNNNSTNLGSKKLRSSASGRRAFSVLFNQLIDSFISDFQAPLPVKAYAKNLIEGIISDTITHVPISDDDDLADEEEDNDKCNINEETDVSLSLETDTAVANAAGSGPSTAVVTSGYPASVAEAAILAATSTKSPSSHVETDSLDESEHAGQHS